MKKCIYNSEIDCEWKEARKCNGKKLKNIYSIQEDNECHCFAIHNNVVKKYYKVESNGKRVQMNKEKFKKIFMAALWEGIPTLNKLEEY